MNRLIAKTELMHSTRIIFALDATMSRGSGWDHSAHLQGRMFGAIPRGVKIKLIHYHGEGICKASKWHKDGGDLRRDMMEKKCASGHSQLETVLRYVVRENEKEKVFALIFCGDMCEENPGDIEAAAEAMKAVPAFMFQEGNDPFAGMIFANVARITRGAHCVLDEGSVARLGEFQFPISPRFHL
jgi:hypothetical protein